MLKRRSSRHTVSPSVGAPAAARFSRNTATKSRMGAMQSLELDVGVEGYAIGLLPGPMQHLLAGLLDAGGGARDGDGQLVAGRGECGFLRRQPHAAHDVLNSVSERVKSSVRLACTSSVAGDPSAPIAWTTTSSIGHPAGACWNCTRWVVAPGRPRGSLLATSASR